MKEIKENQRKKTRMQKEIESESEGETRKGNNSLEH